MQNSMTDDLQLPDDVVDALMSAARESNAIETWLPKRQGVLLRIIPRMLRILDAALSSLPEKVIERKMIRQNALHILSYARADIRLMTIFDLGLNSPEALYDLLSGEIDPEYVPHRYNLVTSLALFARHGLVSSITNPERVVRADKALKKARHLHATDLKDEEET